MLTHSPFALTNAHCVCTRNAGYISDARCVCTRSTGHISDARCVSARHAGHIPDARCVSARNPMFNLVDKRVQGGISQNEVLYNILYAPVEFDAP